MSVRDVGEDSSGRAASSSSAIPLAITSRKTKKREKGSEIIISALGDAALCAAISADDKPA